jgi:hypothetical protein
MTPIFRQGLVGSKGVASAQKCEEKQPQRGQRAVAETSSTNRSCVERLFRQVKSWMPRMHTRRMALRRATTEVD